MAKSSLETPTFDPTDTASAREAAKAQAEIMGDESPNPEQLARRAEKMIAEAQRILESITVESADSSQLEIEREVRQALNELNEVYVSNAQEDHAYSWIFRDPHNEYGGRYVRKMQAMGWEVVSGDHTEAKEHRFVDGTRVVADCILMRIRLDRKMLLDKRDRLLRNAQQAGIIERVQELASRAGTRVYDKLPGFVEESLSSQADQRRVMRQTAARRDFHRMNAGGKIDRMLKTGTIPGIPSPGAGE